MVNKHRIGKGTRSNAKQVDIIDDACKGLTALHMRIQKGVGGRPLLECWHFNFALYLHAKKCQIIQWKKKFAPPPFPIEKILDPTCTSISLFPSKYDPNRLHVTSEQLVSVRQWSLLPLLCDWYFELVLCNWNIRIKQTIYFGSSKQITEIAVPSSPTHDQKCIIRNIAFVINLESTILQ